MPVIIGLGTGRSGSLSLARLINAQPDSVCFHEINPSCMRWAGTPGPVLSMLREFQEILNGGPRDRLTIDLASPHRDEAMPRLQRLDRITTIGEVGFYYLSYVDQIVSENPETRFPCLRRGKDATVKSYVNKMKVKYRRSLSDYATRRSIYRNHFMDHDGRHWVSDPVWDKCYPKFEANSLEEVIGLYWDAYYAQAMALSEAYPQQLRIFELEELNSHHGQRNLLHFCGFTDPQVLTVHENKTR